MLRFYPLPLSSLGVMSMPILWVSKNILMMFCVTKWFQRKSHFKRKNIINKNKKLQCSNRAYSQSLLHAIIMCNYLPFFKIFSHFVHFCPNYQIFCPFLPFLIFFALFLSFSEKLHTCPYFLEWALSSVCFPFHHGTSTRRVFKFCICNQSMEKGSHLTFL